MSVLPQRCPERVLVGDLVQDLVCDSATIQGPNTLLIQVLQKLWVSQLLVVSHFPELERNQSVMFSKSIIMETGQIKLS